MNRLAERLKDSIEMVQRMNSQNNMDLRVAAPGIIESVDYERQTCTVQPAIRERLNFDGKLEWSELPILPDLPFFIYSGGGYCVTLPIKAGDDCLVVFGDSCIDAWWQSGGVQNQIEQRRHYLADGFAIVGFRSQPAVVSNYSANTVQVRNSEGDAFLEISGNTINIKTSGAVNIEGGSVNIKNSTTIDGRKFLSHTHGGILPGGGSTNGVN